MDDTQRAEAQRLADSLGAIAVLCDVDAASYCELLKAAAVLRSVAAANQASAPSTCAHRRYSVDTQEQTGHCYDCGAEGRMVFVVPAAAQASALPLPPVSEQPPAPPAPRYVVKKDSGSYWARVVDTETGMQVARYSVEPRKRSTRDGWKEADRHAAKLNAAAPLLVQPEGGE